jgi:hypothetical protein
MSDLEVTARLHEHFHLVRRDEGWKILDAPHRRR